MITETRMSREFSYNGVKLPDLGESSGSGMRGNWECNRCRAATSPLCHVGVWPSQRFVCNVDGW